MQQLVLVRHGTAADAGPGQRDAERALTGKGRQRSEAVARDLVAIVDSAERVISSELVRAVQTADIIATHMGPDERVVFPGLAPEGDPHGVYAWLQGHAPVSTTVLVGHEPQMNALLGLGLTGALCGPARFDKAGLAILSFRDGLQPGRGKLVLFVPSSIHFSPRA